MDLDEYGINEVKDFIRKLKGSKNGFIFTEPVEKIIESLPDYKDKIKQPIDLLKIENKFQNEQYASLDEMKEDIELMLSNCFTYNSAPDNWVAKRCSNFQEYFNNNYNKLLIKIQKHNEKKSSFLAQKRSQFKEENENRSVSHNTYTKNNSNDRLDNNIPIFPFEDETLSKRVRNLFENVRDFLDVSEETKENVVNSLIKSISKRSKTFDQLYEDIMKFINKHLNEPEVKSKFVKKFRKLIRTLQEEQIEESSKMDGKALNIKIDLNENEEKREEKLKIEQIKKELKNFVDNQKVPDVYLDPYEYPIDPNLKKKIYSFITGIRTKLTTNPEESEPEHFLQLSFIHFDNI